MGNHGLRFIVRKKMNQCDVLKPGLETSIHNLNHFPLVQQAARTFTPLVDPVKNLHTLSNHCRSQSRRVYSPQDGWSTHASTNHLLSKLIQTFQTHSKESTTYKHLNNHKNTFKSDSNTIRHHILWNLVKRSPITSGASAGPSGSSASKSRFTTLERSVAALIYMEAWNMC